ncbi:MAG: transporter substrate-binding domain-containing protein [Prevotellaceae bacterium]|jgi:ABC-type amino acid transport substrate-binding protein|nr:transporter substrate-binding domain-containing protein [Prevotellaceae bacterium]
MKITTTKLLKSVALGAVAALIATFCFSHQGRGKARDFAQINAEGTLRAVTVFNSIGYVIDSNAVSGFQYGLLQALARHYGWRVIIQTEATYDQRLKGLSEGLFDLIASNIATTSEQKKNLLLTTPILLTKQVLVQRREATLVRSHLDLAGKTLYVPKGSPAKLRIRNLEEEIGEAIYIRETDHTTAEQLIGLVADGSIDYAVCDEHIARAASDTLPQIDLNTDISFTQFYSWGVSKESPVLLDSLNAWLTGYMQTGEFRELYDRYYK